MPLRKKQMPYLVRRPNGPLADVVTFWEVIILTPSSPFQTENIQLFGKT